MMGMWTLATLLLLTTGSHAGETAQFLRIGIGARSQGMAGAFTAVADDVSAVYWNPAGLSRLSNREAGFMHAELSRGMRYDFVGYAQPTGYGTLAASAMYLSQANMEGRDSTGRITGEFNASDSAFGISFGRSLGRFGLGLTARFVRSRIAGSTGETAALDAGGLYRLGRLGPGELSLGLAVLNMGPEMSLAGESSPLPLSVGGGASYALPVGLSVGLDVRQRPHAGATEVSIGTEYAVMRNFAMRAGYASNHGTLSGSGRVSDLTGFAAGFGIRFSALSLDYSMTPYGGLGNSHRVSLGARF